MQTHSLCWDPPYSTHSCCLMTIYRVENWIGNGNHTWQVLCPFFKIVFFFLLYPSKEVIFNILDYNRFPPISNTFLDIMGSLNSWFHRKGSVSDHFRWLFFKNTRSAGLTKLYKRCRHIPYVETLLIVSTVVA